MMLIYSAKGGAYRLRPDHRVDRLISALRNVGDVRRN